MSAPPTQLDEIRAAGFALEREEILDALRRARGNVSLAARWLSIQRRDRIGHGVSRQQLYRLMERHGITRPDRSGS